MSDPVAPRTAAIVNLGCKVNQSEMEAAARLLREGGVPLVDPDRGAELVIVNTCTVTSMADEKSRQAVRRARRANPDARVIVTGCSVQVDPAMYARVDPAAILVDNDAKAAFLAELEALLALGRDIVGSGGDLGSAASHEPLTAALPTLSGVEAASLIDGIADDRASVERTRAFVKVQDGCQHRCAFCIVPTARGRSRSQEPQAVVEQIQALVESGYGEVTLTGVDIGHYGWDLSPRTRLAALVRRAAEVKGLRWLRLSSVLPAYFTPELVEAVTSARAVVPHQHLPLQSGSDRVLRLMRRPYNVRMYRTLAEKLATAIPDLGLGTDIIVGHPGESEADFEATMSFVRELPLTYLHVFAYSDRKGTEAAGMDSHAATPVIRERSRRLRALGIEKSLAFRQRLVGRMVDALVLEDTARGERTGLTANYVEVGFERATMLARSFARVRVTEADSRGTRGVLEAA